MVVGFFSLFVIGVLGKIIDGGGGKKVGNELVRGLNS